MPCRGSWSWRRKPGSGFADYGHGDTVVADEEWEARVLQDAALWAKYGCPFDTRAVLPAREYRAHLAILEGEARRVREEQDKAKKKGRRRW